MPRRELKCLVWDLDNTLWSGVLLEGDAVELRPEARRIVETIDERGILQSIASRNDADTAMEKLTDLGIRKYFVYPHINWGPKSASVASIADQLNIGLNTLAFIDDQPYERDEVVAGLPEVLCLDAEDLPVLLDMPEFNPRFITDDARQRRSMYQAEIQRREVEEILPPEEFLESLKMRLTISEPGEEDLDRLEELTVRTNQLNSTGRTYSRQELDAFRSSPDHTLLIAGLDDAYGTYGKVGMALVEHDRDLWHLKLLLMSCRVMSRGVGTILLSHVLQSAAANVDQVQAAFVRTPRNRMMYLTFKLAGFRELSRTGSIALLGHDLESIDPFPEHVEVRLPG